MEWPDATELQELEDEERSKTSTPAERLQRLTQAGRSGDLYAITLTADLNWLLDDLSSIRTAPREKVVLFRDTPGGF